MQHKLPIIAINGVVDAQISPLDRGFTYGDGIFETCRMINAKIPLWRFHAERLIASCDRLMIPLAIEIVENYLAQLISNLAPEDLAEAVVKIIITRGQGGRGYRFSDEIMPTICIAIFPSVQYPEYYYRQGVAVRVCSQRLGCNGSLAGLKHLNRLEHILARAEWRDDSFAEGLLFDSNENLIEATTSNIFIAKDGALFTPDLSEAGVAGVMRRFIVDELAPTLNVAVHIKKISLNDLLAADEVFLCNSVLGIWPVVSVQAAQKILFPVGQLTLQLQQLLVISSITKS